MATTLGNAANGTATPPGVGSTPNPSVPPMRAKQGTDAGASMGTFGVKSGLAQMLKGGVIMDVINAEQARIAEEAGACAVMALERVPADIRAAGGVARMVRNLTISSVANGELI